MNEPVKQPHIGRRAYRPRVGSDYLAAPVTGPVALSEPLLKRGPLLICPMGTAGQVIVAIWCAHGLLPAPRP
jgi:hypothetical protein